MTQDEVDAFPEKEFEFFCPEHGRVLILAVRIWRMTLRCRKCQAVLERNPLGTIEVLDEKPD